MVKHHVNGVDFCILMLNRDEKVLVLVSMDFFWQVTFLDSLGEHMVELETDKS